MWKFDKHIDDCRLELELSKKSNMIDLTIEYSCWETSPDSSKEKERKEDEEMIIEEEDLFISFEYHNLIWLIYLLIVKSVFSWLSCLFEFRVCLWDVFDYFLIVVDIISWWIRLISKFDVFLKKFQKVSEVNQSFEIDYIMITEIILKIILSFQIIYCLS